MGRLKSAFRKHRWTSSETIPTSSTVRINTMVQLLQSPRILPRVGTSLRQGNFLQRRYSTSSATARTVRPFQPNASAQELFQLVLHGLVIQSLLANHQQVVRLIGVALFRRFQVSILQSPPRTSSSRQSEKTCRGLESFLVDLVLVPASDATSM